MKSPETSSSQCYKPSTVGVHHRIVNTAAIGGSHTATDEFRPALWGENYVVPGSIHSVHTRLWLKLRLDYYYNYKTAQVRLAIMSCLPKHPRRTQSQELAYQDQAKRVAQENGKLLGEYSPPPLLLPIGPNVRSGARFDCFVHIIPHAHGRIHASCCDNSQRWFTVYTNMWRDVNWGEMGLFVVVVVTCVTQGWGPCEDCPSLPGTFILKGRSESRETTENVATDQEGD